MASRKDKEKDSGQYITHEQVCELMPQQKAFYKELLQQQESNFKVCMYKFMETTSVRMDTIVKELQELKVSLQFTQKEVDELKASSVSLSSNCKSNEDDIHTVAHKSEYTPHISAINLVYFSRDYTIEMKLGYILE